MKLLINIIVFGGLIAGINGLLRMNLGHIFSGNEILDTKWEYYQANKGRFNVLHFGGSTIANQVDCRQFDAILQPHYPSRSFNFGVGALNIPESFYMLEQVLKADTGDLEYVVFGVSGTTVYPKAFWESSRLQYWLTPGWSAEALYFQWRHRQPWHQKLKITAIVAYKFILNCFDYRYLRKFIHPPDIKTESFYLGEHRDGYTGTDLERWESYITDPPENSDPNRVIFLKNALQKIYHNQRDSAFNDQMLTHTAPYFDAQYTPGPPDPRFLGALERLEALADAKEIRIIYLVAPRLNWHFDILLPVVYTLDERDVIDLSSMKKYPFFYHADHALDMFHLNELGCEKYTRLAAEAFAEKIGR